MKYGIEPGIGVDESGPADNVVSAIVNGVRFYLNDDNTATDIPARAKRFANAVSATRAAAESRLDPAWAGFNWLPQNLNYKAPTRYWKTQP